MKENRKRDSETARFMRSIIAATQLTREELAEKIGVTPRMIYHYLQGRSEPRASIYIEIQKLAKQ